MVLAFGFLNAWALWLLPLAAIPIVIHLLNRRRFDKVRWAAMTFLLAAMKRNRRRLRMEHWLILLLRTLAVVLLVLLVSRPSLDENTFGASVREHHVVCLDDSASMAQRGPADDAFAAAIALVETLVTDLADRRDGDLLTVLRSSALDAPVMPITSISAETPRRVRSELARLRVGDGRFDPGAVLAAAQREYRASEGAERAEYHIVTDLRRADWLDSAGGPHAAARDWLLARDATSERVSILGVGANDTANLGITAITCRERVCTVGLPVTFAIEVTNHGLDGASTGAGDLTIEIDGRSRTNHPLPPLGGGASTTIEIAHTFRDAGPHGLVAHLPGDRFPVDDVRHFAIEIREQSRILLVDGDPGDSPETAESYYLHAALEIRGAIDSGIEVRLVGEHELADQDEAALAEYDMVWLCNVGRPDARAVERLTRFVEGGGGLVVYLGNQVDLTHYNDTMFRGGAGVLPAMLVEVGGDVDAPRQAHLASPDHAMFANNTRDLEYMFAQLVSVGRYVRVDAPTESSARVLLRVGDNEGPPLLLSKEFGAGRTFLFTSSADANWNSMPLWPVFVLTNIAMHRQGARPQDFAGSNLSPDGVATFALDPGRFRRDILVAPLDEVGTAGVTFSADANATGLTDVEVPMRALTGYGLFRATKQRFDGTEMHRLLARNPHTVEGLLARLTPEQFRATYPAELADRVTIRDGDPASNEAALTLAGAGAGSLWRLTGVALLLGMLLETLLAWRFGRR